MPSFVPSCFQVTFLQWNSKKQKIKRFYPTNCTWSDLMRTTNTKPCHTISSHAYILNHRLTNLYKFSQGCVHTSNAQLPVLGAFPPCKSLKLTGSKPLLVDHNALLSWNWESVNVNHKSTTAMARICYKQRFDFCMFLYQIFYSIGVFLWVNTWKRPWSSVYVNMSSTTLKNRLLN